MSKRTKIMLSFMLVICLLLSSLPGALPAVAVEAEQFQTGTTDEDPSATAAETSTTVAAISGDVTILSEDVLLRGEYEKHFLMSDGTYQVALYNEPVHQLEDGEWVEIDNTLSLQTVSDGTARYSTVNGLSDVSFAQTLDDQLVTMRQDDYSVSWGVQAVSGSLSTMTSTSVELTQPVQAELVTDDLSAFSEEQQKTLAVKSSSAIQYSNALGQDVDLEYIVLPSRVKENIILQITQDISCYVVTVYTENLSARLLENREIEFYNDSDEVIFTMTSPYMYDSTGELSENIAVEMTSKGSGCYLVQMSPDAQWLADESRVYPVVIDPEVSVDTTRTNIIDNYVLKDSGVQNRNLDRLYIGNRSEGLTRAFIQYATMPTLPEGATITAATMTLTFTNGTDTAATASAYKVTGAEWASGTIQWSNMPAASTLLASNISHNNLTGYSFSCKSAVQAWYDGDTTGQNANYGIMLRYYDETVDDYNAVYSADYTDETKRPALTITYQGNSVNILEGYTRTLSVSGTSGTVTWTSSNTAVATVNSSGVVTGVKAGKATITASVNGSAYQTFPVYVKIQDGVYYISNMAFERYLGTSGSIAETTVTTLYTKATSGRAQLNQLWKITYLDIGYYSIRPMYMQSMGLHVTSNVVDVTSIGTTNTLSGVPAANRWGIEYSSSGYLLKYVGSNSLTMKATNSYSDYVVSTGGYSASTSGFLWSLEKISSVSNQVLLLDTPSGVSVSGTTKYVEPNSAVSLSGLGVAASFVCMYSTDQSITWSTQDPSVVSVNSQTGTITPLIAGGTATIVAKHIYNGVEYEARFAVYIKTVPNGTYFIRSRAYNKYMQINNRDASNDFSTSGASMEQWAYHGFDFQKWSITWRGSGYYSVISVQSGMALTVPSDQTASTEVSLVQEAYTGSTRQLWKITATSEGRYKIKARSSESASGDLVMSAGHGSLNDSNSVAIEQCQYTNDDKYNDEWFICSIVDFGMSTDNNNIGCSHGELYADYYAETFYDTISYPMDYGLFTLTHRLIDESVQTASPDDFKDIGAISNEIDFMVYIGHGHSASSHATNGELGNHLHYDCGMLGSLHVYNEDSEQYTYCNPEGNVYTKEMRFGSSTSDLRWVWLYTCHFLSSNEYVSDDDLKDMMAGAHIVMGYATQSFLCEPNVTIFSQYLREGRPIIESYFSAGKEGEVLYANDNHLQKVLYIEQAENETIYSPMIHYEYDPSDVKIVTSYIKDGDN